MIKNIILDVGKVLVEWQPIEKMREWGYSDEIISHLSKAIFDSGVWYEVDKGVLSNDEFLALAISQVSEYKKEFCYFWEHLDQVAWQMPYAVDWIHAIKKAGYHVYILSNYGRWTYEKTKRDALSFLKDVDGALFSYEVKQVKPDSNIFLSLFKRYSLVPEECVFLDDLEENIEGAKAVGMQGIIFTGLEESLIELEKIGVKISMTEK